MSLELKLKVVGPKSRKFPHWRWSGFCLRREIRSTIGWPIPHWVGSASEAHEGVVAQLPETRGWLEPNRVRYWTPPVLYEPGVFTRGGGERFVYSVALTQTLAPRFIVEWSRSRSGKNDLPNATPNRSRETANASEAFRHCGVSLGMSAILPLSVGVKSSGFPFFRPWSSRPLLDFFLSPLDSFPRSFPLERHPFFF